jgi:hypothetical protein
MKHEITILAIITATSAFLLFAQNNLPSQRLWQNLANDLTPLANAKLPFYGTGNSRIDAPPRCGEDEKTLYRWGVSPF